MSASARDNPKWFSLDSSEKTQPIRKNEDLHRPMQFRDDDDRTMTTMATKAQAFRPSSMSKAKDMKYPTGDVTIVFTDVQGSTSIWEACPSDMKKALDIHDMIMRQCYTDHNGYEITTEGDAFNLAFQHPADALAFALQAQLKLYKADWPDGILKHPDGKDEPALKLRGFRVRFGIHHGPTTSGVHEMTGRTVYSGEGVDIAKTVEGMCHGGQILTTMETWKAVSGMAERYLGRPQVLDLGEHLLYETKSQTHTTRYTRRIMQLVPSDLAFDFFEARGRRDVPSEDGQMEFEVKNSSAINGRLFPPITSKRQLTTCFLNAPYANGKVTICFVHTVGLDDNPDNRSRNLGVLAKYLRKQLLLLNPPGYECQEDNGCWMIAFDRMAHGVSFGLQMKSTLQGVDDLVGTVDRDKMYKVGIVSGPFTSMGPHKITGMGDYFGPIVNRTARVVSNCEPGQVCVGIALTNGVTADPPDFGPTIGVKLQGIKKLKGVTIDMAIFECFKRRIETPYM
jgi:class 3 adenylate cyclase